MHKNFYFPPRVVTPVRPSTSTCSEYAEYMLCVRVLFSVSDVYKKQLHVVQKVHEESSTTLMPPLNISTLKLLYSYENLCKSQNAHDQFMSNNWWTSLTLCLAFDKSFNERLESARRCICRYRQ